MPEFEVNQVVKSKKYGVGQIKKIVGYACTFYTPKKVYGSNVHIVKLETLSAATSSEVAEFEAQEEKADE